MHVGMRIVCICDGPLNRMTATSAKMPPSNQAATKTEVPCLQVVNEN